jgi:hypothetical protein
MSNDDSGRPSMPGFQVRVPVEWEERDDVPLIYANQVMVSHGGPEFFIVLGVVVPPNNPDRVPESYRIQPQVRIAISREAMPAIVQALSDNLARYRASVARQSNAPPPAD